MKNNQPIRKTKFNKKCQNENENEKEFLQKIEKAKQKSKKK